MSAMRILLAENNQDQPNQLLLMLVGMRSRVTVTRVGRSNEVLSQLRRDRYDCLIVDAGLPDCDAEELAKTARRKLGDRVAVVLILPDGYEPTKERQLSRDELILLSRAQATQAQQLTTCVQALVLQCRRRERDRRKTKRHRWQSQAAKPKDPIEAPDQDSRGPQPVSQQDRSGACIAIDIERLGTINETWGRGIGDEVIRAVADRIQVNMAPTDQIVRCEDGRLVILAALVFPGDAWIWALRLQRAIEQSVVRVGKIAVHTSVTVGVAAVSYDVTSCQAIDRAHQAIQTAKQRRHYRLCTWDMVVIKRLLGQLLTHLDLPGLDDRRLAFLERCQYLLGPTQLEHVTSHADRVSAVAVGIGQLMGVGRERLRGIRDAALLHDIGKCVIPEDILGKPASLTIEQWHVMAQHAHLGADIASGLGADELVVDIVRHHHARYDSHAGRFSRHAFWLGAMVLSVADALVTMTTDRTYRPAHSSSQMIMELQRQRGRQFDPKVVDAALLLGPPLTARAA